MNHILINVLILNKTTKAAEKLEDKLYEQTHLINRLN